MQPLQTPLLSAARTCSRLTSLRSKPLRPPPSLLSITTTTTTKPFTTKTPPPSSGAALLPPLNLPKWLSENSHLLQPPINNFCIYHEPLTVMVVGGPNARTDYHINTTPEFFYQYRGRMLLKTIQHDATKEQQGEEEEVFKDIYINEGELFLLPANVPHNPVRFADTVGLVIEQPRPEGSEDRLRWYCAKCRARVHEVGFVCRDLGRQIKEAVQAFRADEGKRRCGRCGEVCRTAPSKEEAEAMRLGG